MQKTGTENEGFSFIELLLVITTLAILFGIVMIIFQTNRLGEARNARRWSDVRTILDAVYEYSIDHSGHLPASITYDKKEICRTGASDCTGYADLSVLTFDRVYLTQMPEDLLGATGSGTGYQIVLDGKRVTVFAPFAENDVTIEATK